MTKTISQSAAVWQLELLGDVRLVGPQGEVRLPRNAAGLLAYLALEGPTSKYQLASWLWPDGSEEAVRANMRKLLQRLRQSTNAELVLGNERLELAEMVAVDAVQLSAHSFAGDYAKVVASEGKFLEGIEFDDSPELEEWLVATRESLDTLRHEAATSEAEKLEQEGKYTQALSFAKRALELESVSEEAHRRIMRLHYLLGDKGAALAAFEKCKDILKREFGAEPLPETLELARLIEKGERLPGVKPVKKVPLQHPVAKAPSLVGREREWEQMEEAYQQGQLVFLRGEPGVGKTRLALEFAASKGTVRLLSPRPGDANVPYATFARAIREVYDRSVIEHLPAWVKRELSRIVPELAEDDMPPPLASEAERLRFFDALVDLNAASRGGTIIADDAQYMDAATTEALMYLLTNRRLQPLAERAGHTRNLDFTIEIYRKGELDSEIEKNVVDKLVQAGLAVLIDVEPLPKEAVGKLLETFQPGLAKAAAQMTRFTGGNPLFVVETVRHLQETGQLERGLPSHLPPPSKVATVINQRLGKLSPRAINIARAAAILQSDFNVHLIAGVLEAKTIDLMEPWQELEHAQLFQGNGFSHDLIYEAVQEGISNLLKTFLHRRAAEVLTEMKANPARIAKHWLEAGEALQAAPALLQAATQADFASRVSEATQFAEQAVTIYAQNGDKEKEFDALAQLSRFIQGTGDNERLGQLSSRLLAKASTPEMRGKAFNERAWYLYRVGKLEESLRAVEQGLEHLQTTNNLYYQAELKQLESQLSLRLGFAERAARALAEMRVLAEKLGDPEAIIAAIIEQGRLVASQDKHREALHLYKEALAAMKEWGKMSYGQVAVLSLCADAEKTLGNSEAALEYVREAWQLNERYSAGAHVQAGLLLTEAGVYRVTGNYPDALALTERAIDLDKNGLWGQQARYARAEILLEMGEVNKATKELEHLLAQELEPSVRLKCERALSKLVKA